MVFYHKILIMYDYRLNSILLYYYYSWNDYKKDSQGSNFSLSAKKLKNYWLPDTASNWHMTI